MAGSAAERRMKIESRWVERGRYALIVLAAIAGIAEGAGHLFKDLWTWVPVVPRLVLVGATAAESIWGISRARRWKRVGDRRAKIEKTLTSAVVAVGKETGIDVDCIGCSAWFVERDRKTGEETLYRAATVRLSGYPPPSSVSWTKGKGVIGRCWDKNETRFCDWTELQNKFPRGKAVSNTAFARLGQRAWGFTQDELLERIWKYQQILAVPMTDHDGNFLGCLSMDIPNERRASATIDTVEVREILARNGVTVRDMVTGGDTVVAT